MSVDSQSATCAGDVLCIGIDVTWWGGSTSLASQRETIAACRLDATGNVHCSLVNLNPGRASKNPLSTEPNFDADGKLLLNALDVILQKLAPNTKCVLALDAPLEATVREGQPARVKTVAKGEKSGSKRRQCEHELWSFASGIATEQEENWLTDLKIQSGSPIPPRISRILEGLADRGFSVFAGEQERRNRLVIEVFPSEAIWALGVQGHYGSQCSQDVRAYKRKKPTSLNPVEARLIAERPLLGFLGTMNSELAERAVIWGKTLAQTACDVSMNKKTNRVQKGKGFDDPIDSGIALLTCVAFSTGQSHHWGDGTDGVIVGPGVGLMRPKQLTVPDGHKKRLNGNLARESSGQWPTSHEQKGGS